MRIIIAYMYISFSVSNFHFPPNVQNKPRRAAGRDQANGGSDHRVPGRSGQAADPSTSAEAGSAGPPQVPFLQGQTTLTGVIIGQQR